MSATNGNILVVEDTHSVADLIQEMLKSFGYQATVCLTVKEALAEFAGNKFDLIITDYTMPGMTGVELAEVIRKTSPNQLILLITGSAASMTDNSLKKLPVNATLQKPFSVMEFHEAITVLLNGGVNTDSAAIKSARASV